MFKLASYGIGQMAPQGHGCASGMIVCPLWLGKPQTMSMLFALLLVHLYRGLVIGILFCSLSSLLLFASLVLYHAENSSVLLTCGAP